MYGRHSRADPTLAEPLEHQGLLRVLEPEWFVDQDAVVRKTFLVVLAQLTRTTGLRHGLDLQPISDDPAVPAAFHDFLQLKPMPSHGEVVAFDANEVSIDLEAVSLEEVLQYRRENGAAHRRYMKNMRTFALKSASPMTRNAPVYSPSGARSYMSRPTTAQTRARRVEAAEGRGRVRPRLGRRRVEPCRR
jgi:hypothetical protein